MKLSAMKLIGTSLTLVLGLGAVYAQDKSDSLKSGFENPPASARPRVWWHWMNGNITKEGIKLDLEWMHRVGIAGFQNFDAADRKSTRLNSSHLGISYAVFCLK